jgi:predicted PurR-regulated permease PerM
MARTNAITSARTDDFDHTDMGGDRRKQEERALGRRGEPVSRRHPFHVGFMAALGVAVAYVLFRTVSDLGTVLELIGLALFLAVGFEPAVAWLKHHRCPRSLAVVIVIFVLCAFVAGFVAAAVAPIGREIHELRVTFPKWKADAESGKGWIGHLVRDFHLQSAVKSGKITKKINASTVASGVVGAGKLVISAVSAVVITGVLTVYFLIAMPAVRTLWLRFWPRSRRERVEALTDEVLSRVGGFVLGNLLTSIIAGLGTWIWALVFGIPYPLLLALLVAVLDLIPLVGSTIAGVVVALVALAVSLPVAIATVAFYIGYRFLEDYLLTPRVMRHTVKISPGLTIVAALIGGALLGLIGALIAIPVAAGVRLVLEEVTFPSLDRS